MANLSQVAVLTINDSSDNMGIVTNYGIQLSQGSDTVNVSVTLSLNFDDKSPVFDFFVQNQPATIKILIENSLASGGPTTRTLSFENAVCKDYVETYAMANQTFDNMNDLMVSFVFQADSATLGETSFPA